MKRRERADTMRITEEKSMLDLKTITQNAEWVRENLKKLGALDAPLDEVLNLDSQRKRLLSEVDSKRAERNATSKKIGGMAEGQDRQALVEAMRELGDGMKSLEDEARKTEEALLEALLRMPNMPDPDVPVGASDAENRVVQEPGELPEFDFEPLPHWEIGEALGIIDFERGAKLSGSRFYVLLREGARLQRALIAWMIDLHVQKHGYTEVYPPFMVRRECLVGTGNLPKFGENLYRDIEEDFWWVPTAEVPVTNLHREEILEGSSLPITYVAYTACFRREKMSAGKDVRGIKRGHQFDKVEMVKFVTPESSDQELRSLVSNAEDVCVELGLPHRVVQMCTGDLSFTAAKKFDVEIWAPGCREWLEVSSCSNFKDFQARRAHIRFRRDKKQKPEFVHTLNGSGLALPRVLIGVIETYQQSDGSVIIPEVLRPYMGGLERIARRG